MRKASSRELLMLLVVAVIALGLGFPRWTSANLITNGGFEAGDFTGWALSGNVSGSTFVEPIAAHTPNFGALLGAIGSLNFLSQTLTTVPGTAYEIIFWQLFDGGLPDEFSVSWAGTVLSDLVNHGATTPGFSGLTTWLSILFQGPEPYSSWHPVLLDSGGSRGGGNVALSGLISGPPEGAPGAGLR